MGTVKTKYFDYGQKEMDYLKSADETLGAAMERLGKVEREIIPDLFAALIYAIIGQLISVKAGHTIWDRMQERFGEITSTFMSKLVVYRKLSYEKDASVFGLGYNGSNGNI
jgi:DNA-3-methyladenine glycosylase II